MKKTISRVFFVGFATFLLNCTKDLPEEINVGGNGGGSDALSTSTAGEGGAGGEPSNEGGNGGESNCKPKSCQAQGKSCGFIDNGCGVMIECNQGYGNSECVDLSRPYLACGESSPNDDGSYSEGNENVCGGGCTALRESISIDTCSEERNLPYAIVCSKKLDVAPTNVECKFKFERENTSWWCCADKYPIHRDPRKD